MSCESVCWWKEKEYFNKLFTTSFPIWNGLRSGNRLPAEQVEKNSVF